MELQCPGCQKKLAIADQHAGQMIKCPSCGGMFMAPSLPSMPAPAVPVAPATPVSAIPPASNEAPGTIPFAPAPPPPPPHADMFPPIQAIPPKPTAPISEVPMEPIPDVPPGEYTRTRVMHLSHEVVEWLAPVGTAILFFLSFGAWIGMKNLWVAAFDPVDTALIFYVLLTFFLGMPLAWVKLAFEKGWIPKQDFLRPIWPFRSLLVAGVLGLSFLILLVLWVMGNLGSGVHVTLGNPTAEPPVHPTIVISTIALSMKLAVRVHLIAVLGALAEYWLEQRRKRRLPLPEATIRW